jgi:hypothetical protein
MVAVEGITGGRRLSMKSDMAASMRAVSNSVKGMGGAGVLEAGRHVGGFKFLESWAG